MFMFPSNHPNYFLQTKMSLACARVLKGCGCGVRGEPLLPVLVVANSSRIRCRYQRLRARRRVECRVNFSIVVQHDPAIVVALAQDRKECGEIHTPRAENLVEIHSVVLLPARSRPFPAIGGVVPGLAVL